MYAVMTKANIQGKLNDRGAVCVFLGYLQSHSKNVYRILNLKTNRVVKSRYFIWLNKVMKS
jgi:hypothetical protein